MAAEKGFTLIELMVTVAIIVVLAALALPAYQDYSVRARVSEAIVSLGAQKNGVMENFVADSELTEHVCADITSMRGATTNVASLSCTGQGVLVVKTTSAAGSVTLTLSPELNPDRLIEWKCALSEGKPSHVPVDCRT
ncbi:pilin [Stenotrophomonas sp. TWI602]|uniref:pilin n=1 Tax=Stenotrophomonas sp. TWI602 TaxID=3136786 RepID=UPI0032084E40